MIPSRAFNAKIPNSINEIALRQLYDYDFQAVLLNNSEIPNSIDAIVSMQHQSYSIKHFSF